MAERSSLLNCRTRKGTQGSNPCLSALFIYMTTQEAKNILSKYGYSTCSCKYQDQDAMILKAIQLKEQEEQS